MTKFMPFLKRYLIFIIFGGILLTIIISIMLVSSQGQQDTTIVPTTTLPSLTPAPTDTFPVTPTLSDVIEKYPVTYDNDASKRIWAKVSNKPQLSSQDNEAKTKLLKENLKDSGIVYQSTNVKVDYISTFDFFQAEILTEDFTFAKEETVLWLKSYGLSQQGICDLPLIFNLNTFVAQSLTEKNVIFSPVAEGC